MLAQQPSEDNASKFASLSSALRYEATRHRIESFLDDEHRASAVAFSAVIFCALEDRQARLDEVEKSLRNLSSVCFCALQPGPDDVPRCPTRGSELVQRLCYRDKQTNKLVKWGEPQMYVPGRAAIVGEAVPLMPLPLFHKFIYSYPWIWAAVFVFFCAAGVALTMAAVMADSHNELYSGLGLSILSVILTIQVSMYSRPILLQLVRVFEFWFLSAQLVIVVCSLTYANILSGHNYWILPLRIYMDTMMCIALFGIDASMLRRLHKGTIMGLIGMYWVLWSILLGKFSPDVFKQNVSFLSFVYRSTVGHALQSAFLTMGVFCFKYSFTCLVLKHDAVLLRFAPNRLHLGEVTASKLDQDRQSSEDWLLWEAGKNFSISNYYKEFKTPFPQQQPSPRTQQQQQAQAAEPKLEHVGEQQDQQIGNGTRTVGEQQVVSTS